MKKNGFTLVEMLVVVVILGILVSVAIISVSSNRNRVNEKEIDVLRSTFVSAFQNYRIHNYVSDNVEVGINNLRFSNAIYYNNNKCSNLGDSSIKYVIRKNVSSDSDSLEEIFCIKFVCNNEIIINDYGDNIMCQ